MDQEQVFRQTILEDPGDDTTRLVFADWLEENNNPLGEFIHLQYALEGCTSARERGRLRRRIRELLRAHEAQWVGTLPGLVGSYGFRRGFPELISLRGAALVRHAARIVEQTPLWLLHLTDLHAQTVVDRLATCKHLAGVRALQLTDSDITPAGVERLFDSPHLSKVEELSLDLAFPRQESTRLLSNPRIERLRLNLNAHLQGSEGAHAFVQMPNLPHLRRVVVRGSNLGDEGLQVLCRSRLGGKVIELHLGYNHVGTAGVCAIAESRNLSRLRTLILDRSSLDPAALTALSQARHLGRLRRLHLRDVALSVEGLRALLTSTALPRLAELDLAHNRLGEEGALLFTVNPQARRLRTLGLGSNQLDAAGAMALGQSRHLAHLRRLNLDNNRLGDRGLRLLLAENAFVRLGDLSLYLNNLTDFAMRELAASSCLSRLRRLNLNGNSLGESGIIALATSPHLHRLRWLSMHSGLMSDRAALAILDSPSMNGLTDLQVRSLGGLSNPVLDRLLKRFPRGR